MIYYKKNSLWKKIKRKLSSIHIPSFFLGCFKSFSFLIKALVVVSVLFLGVVYLSYLYLLPKYLDEAKIETYINGIVQKNTKLTFDTKGFEIVPNYRLNLGLRAKYIKLNYPNKTNFITLENPDIEVDLVSLFKKEIDFTKIKTDKISISSNFTKQKRYNFLDYFDFQNNKLDLGEFSLKNTKFEIENFIFTLYDENIKRNFYIKASDTVLSFGENPFKLKTKGKISSNKTLVDFNWDMEFKIDQKTLADFLSHADLSYNPMYEMDKINFYSNSISDIKISQKNEKPLVFGNMSLKDIRFLNLPKNNIDVLFKGDKVLADFDFNFIKNQFVKVNLNFNNSKNKFIECKMKSNDIDLAVLKEFLSGFWKILNIDINPDEIDISGLAKVDLYLRSDFRKILSKGIFKIENMSLKDKTTGLFINKINSNINLENNTVNIIDTSAFIDKSKFFIKGRVDSNTNLDIDINSEKINMAQVLNLAAKLPLISSLIPKLDDYIFKSGFVVILAKIRGNLNNPIIDTNSKVSNLRVFVKPAKSDFVSDVITIKAQPKLNEIKDIDILALNNSIDKVKIPSAKLKISNDLIKIENTTLSYDNIKAQLEGKIEDYKRAQNLDLALNINDKGEIILPELGRVNFGILGLINIKGTQKSPLISADIKLSNLKNAIFGADEINLNLKNKTINSIIKNLKIKNSTLDIISSGSIKDDKIVLDSASIISSYLNLDDIMEYRNLQPDIDVSNIEGDIKNLIVSNLEFDNTKFKGSYQKNTLNLSDFSAGFCRGNIKGKIKISLQNLKSDMEFVLSKVNIRYLPKEMNKYLIATSGNLSALLKGEVQGIDFNSAIKTFKGYIKFNIDDGELSQFVKLERLLRAGNIVSQNLMKLDFNLTLSNLTRQNTGYFKTLEGTLNIEDAQAEIQYINTKSENLSMHIEGRCNLISELVNVIVLGRIPNSLANSITASQRPNSALENMTSDYIPETQIAKIPDLYGAMAQSTREFIVLVSGNPESLKSLKYFKWRRVN